MTTSISLANEAEINKGSVQPWLLAIILVAIAPALHTLATWDLDGRLARQAFAIRHYSYMIVLVEILVIGLAISRKMSIQAELLELPKAVLMLIGLWLAFALAALFWNSDGIANATFILMRYAIHGLFLLGLVFIIRNSDRFEIHRWLAILTAGTVAYVLLLVIFFIAVPEPEKFPWVVMMPSATNIRQIGNNVGILALAPIALLTAKGRPFSWLHAAALVTIFAFVTWTGSRATLLGIVVGVGIGLLIVRHVSSVKNIFVVASSALAGSIMSLLAPIPHPAFGLFRLIKSSSEQIDPSSGRWVVWDQAWQQIMQSPWIGYGAGRYREQMNLLYGTEWNHPHNFILQYIYDWGFFGGSFALALIGILGFKIWRVRDADPMAHFTAITAFTAICFTALIDSPLFHPLPIAVALTLIAPVFAKSETL